MTNLSHANGKDNIAAHPIVQQLQSDVAQIKRDLPDYQQRAISSVAFVERTDQGLIALKQELAELRKDNAQLKEMVNKVIDTSNKIFEAVQGLLGQ